MFNKFYIISIYIIYPCFVSLICNRKERDSASNARTEITAMALSPNRKFLAVAERCELTLILRSFPTVTCLLKHPNFRFKMYHCLVNVHSEGRGRRLPFLIFQQSDSKGNKFGKSEDRICPTILHLQNSSAWHLVLVLIVNFFPLFFL